MLTLEMTVVNVTRLLHLLIICFSLSSHPPLSLSLILPLQSGHYLQFCRYFLVHSMNKVYAFLVAIARIGTNSGMTLSKCCDKYETFSWNEEQCLEHIREDLNETRGNMAADLIDNEEFMKVDWEYRFIDMVYKGHNECLDLVLVEDNVTIDAAGLLNTEEGPPSDLYCLDTIKDSDSDGNFLILKCSKDGPMLNETSLKMKTWRIVFSAFSILSSVSLFLTFVVYIIVPGLLNFQGVLVLCNLITMFLATIYILAVFNMKFSQMTCSIIGYFGYFISLSMFLWMTVTCVDIYITLTHQNLVSNLSKASKKWKLSVYVSVSWGLAFLITIFLLMLQTFYFSPESKWNPKVGETMCFLQTGGYSRLVFFHVPILILISGNLFLFLVIMIRLSRKRKQTRLVRMVRQQSARNREVGLQSISSFVESHSIQNEKRQDFAEQTV